MIAAAPALPLHEAGKYVVAAYLVFLALVLIYVAIMAAKLSRIGRDLHELNELADARLPADGPAELPVADRQLAASGAPER